MDLALEAKRVKIMGEEALFRSVVDAYSIAGHRPFENREYATVYPPERAFLDSDEKYLSFFKEVVGELSRIVKPSDG